MPILFYGDPHRVWEPLYEAVAARRADHVVLMGDYELDRPLSEVVAPVLATGAKVWWIHGNHDAHSPQMWEFLFEDRPEWSLSGRVVEMACSEGGSLRLAGLGGQYKGKVWFPKEGGEVPGCPTREEFLRRQGKGGRFKSGIPLGQRQTIFPEDHEALARLRCDVLVTHEAPRTVASDRDGSQMGFGAIDDLARDMGTKLVVHGHHHRAYEAATRDRIAVRGLGGAELWWLSPSEVP